MENRDIKKLLDYRARTRIVEESLDNNEISVQCPFCRKMYSGGSCLKKSFGQYRAMCRRCFENKNLDLEFWERCQAGKEK